MLDRMGVQGCQCGEKSQEGRNRAGPGGKGQGNISALRWLSMRKHKRSHLEPSQTSSSGCEQWRSHKLLPKDTRIGDSRQYTPLGLLCSHTKPGERVMGTSLTRR